MLGRAAASSPVARRQHFAVTLARAEAEAATKEANAAHARLREAIDILPQGIVFLDADGRYRMWNREYAEIYKRSADLFQVGARLEDTLRIGVARGDYPESAGCEEAWIAERLSRLYEPGQRHEQWLADGRCVLIEERRTSDGGIIGLRVDITEIKEREQSFRLLFDANPVPMFVVDRDSHRIIEVNDAALAHYGYGRDELLGLGLRDIHDQRDHGELAALYGSARDGDLAGRTWTHLKKCGERIDVAIYSKPVTRDRQAAVLFAAIDITERKRAEAQVSYMAHHDSLTGLPNRVLLRLEMEHLLETTRRAPANLAVLFIDLDNFKGVNDSFGHPAGDALLQLVAKRIEGSVREGDIAARLGGDEFAVVMPQFGGVENVTSLAQRLIREVSAPYVIDGNQILVGASIGIALEPTDGDTVDKLLTNADLALYRAKQDGKGAFRFFEAEMNARVQARRRLESELRLALAAELLEVHYQPLVTFSTGRVIGAEALVRWPHRERGSVPPSEFIPIAEEAGLISQLGAYVLRRACTDATKWPSDVKLAVNLSPSDFRMGDVLETVQGALKTSGLDPRRLEIEITETVFMERSDHVLSTLHALRALGASISLDDFGTGYSSLSYLRSFPFDKLKIDRSFVREIYSNFESQAIVRAIMGLGTSLGMRITAEGIETETELACLRAVGCNEGQGFLFSKARPQADFVSFATCQVREGQRKARSMRAAS